MDSADYYTSGEDTLIPLDESHVSKLLATCASVGSLRAVTIRRISTHCQGDDVLAPVVKVPFHDSLYCWGRHAFKIPTRGESMSRMPPSTMELSYCWEQHTWVSQFREKSNISTHFRWQVVRYDITNWHPSMISTVNPLLRYCTSQVSYVSFNLSWIFGVRGVFGIITQIWHPCGVANMIVYPSLALSPLGYAWVVVRDRMQ